MDYFNNRLLSINRYRLIFAALLLGRVSYQALFTRYNLLSNRLYNPVWQPVERTVAVRSTGLTTGLTNGCIV